MLARMYADFGPPTVPVSREEPFEALVRAIVYQQLAGAAARAIHGRLVAALEGEVTPEQMLGLGVEQLRAGRPVGQQGAQRPGTWRTRCSTGRRWWTRDASAGSATRRS